MRNVIGFLLFLAILLGCFFYGLNLYVSHLNPLKPRLEKTVQTLENKYKVTPITYNKLPKFYIKAVVSTEDRRFFSDPGIDPIGIARSLVVDVSKGRYAQGGSTITQQLVDNTFLTRSHSLTYKLSQSIYAIGIYDSVPKKNVFEMYANLIYFGEGSYGITEASETYFKKKPWELNEGELAMLAGIPNSPNNFDPLKHYKLARKREAAVLQNMVDVSDITKEEAKVIDQKPIRLVKKK